MMTQKRQPKFDLQTVIEIVKAAVAQPVTPPQVFTGEVEVLSPDEVEKIFAQPTPFDGVTEEELLYWATPHFDYLQEQKELKKKRIEEEKI